MSLIEKALNKTQSTNASEDSGVQPLVPRPRNLVGRAGRPPRIGLMATLGVLIGLVMAGGWLLMEYLPDSSRQEDRKLSPQQFLQGSKQSSEKTTDSIASESDKTLHSEEHGQQASAEPQEKSGESQEGAIHGPNHSPTLLKPEPKTSDVKSPTFQGTQERSYPQKPRHEASAPQAAKSSGKAGEQRTQAEQKQRILLEKAYIQAQAGHLPAALQIYDQLLAREPQQLEALVNRGVLRMRMGDLPGAKRDLLEAKRLTPRDPTLLNALGVLHLETGELEEAAHYFRSSPEPASLVNLALLYWRKGSRERAWELLEEAQGRIPQDPWIAYYRALLLRELGKQKQAREEMDKARLLALKRGDMELVHQLETSQSGP